MTTIEIKAVAEWRKAAADLGFQFTAPYIANSKTGARFEALGLVHQFGGRIGTLISVDPDADTYPETGEGYGVSYLGYSKYKRAVWIEILDDWGFWGEPSQAPDWYEPGPVCHLHYAKDRPDQVA